MTDAQKTPEQDLMALAAETRARAYAPYSNYLVGAAVRTPDGRVFVGCNVENASYGLTVCAERVAIFSAVAAGHTRVTEVAIMTPSRGAPCGACRQVLLEFGGPELIVRLADPDGGARERRLSDLLPEAFGPDDLRAGGG